MIRRRTLLTAAGGTLLGSALATGTARADATIAVSPGTSYGTWEGWGTSLAWWANVFGARDDFADIFFTTKSTTYNGTSLPGLGLNIARYNLGACSWNTVGGESMVASANIPAFKQIEGYWQDWNNEDPTSSAWKWTADANQRAMLVKATSRGATSELFANSPMWWMCQNHNPSGASGGGNNLQTWNYRQHASHLASVALYAKNNWGVNFSTVDAFNEPSSSWWTATGTQEGCHMDATVQSAVLPYLRSELNNRGLTGVKISASDETSYDLARTTWNSFSSTTKGYVNQVNVHGYQGADGRRDLLYTDVVTTAGKKLWNSETGDGDGTGYTTAFNLLYDFRWLHPTAWVYWQVMDPTAGWGVIKYDGSTLEVARSRRSTTCWPSSKPAHPPRHEDPRHGCEQRGRGLRLLGQAPGHRGPEHLDLGPDPDLRPVPLHHGDRRLGRPGPALEHGDDGRRQVHVVLEHLPEREVGGGAVRGEGGADAADRRRDDLSPRCGPGTGGFHQPAPGLHLSLLCH